VRGRSVLIPLALITQLAMTCAPGVAPETLAAIAQTESHFNPLAIHDNTTSRFYSPADDAAAITTAQRLATQGHSVDLGLMQINNRNLGLLGLSINKAFDPCASLAASAELLSSFSRYNTGSPTRGFENGYVAKIVQADSALKGAPTPAAPMLPQPPTRPPLPWNVFADESGTVPSQFLTEGNDR
jgi:type IV secretion system protein VirB1